MDAIVTDPRIHVIEDIGLNEPGSAIKMELTEVRAAMAGTQVPPDALDLLVLLKHMTGFIHGRYADKTREMKDCLPTLHAMTASDSHIVAIIGDLFDPEIDDRERNEALSRFLRDNNVVSYCYFSEGSMSKVTTDHEPTEEEVEEMMKKVMAKELPTTEIAVFHAETLHRAVVYAFPLTPCVDGSKDMGDCPVFVHKAERGKEEDAAGDPVRFLLDGPPTILH